VGFKILGLTGPIASDLFICAHSFYELDQDLSDWFGGSCIWSSDCCNLWLERRKAFSGLQLPTYSPAPSDSPFSSTQSPCLSLIYSSAYDSLGPLLGQHS